MSSDGQVRPALIVLAVTALGFVTLGRARSEGKFRDGEIGRLKQAVGDVQLLAN